MSTSTTTTLTKAISSEVSSIIKSFPELLTHLHNFGFRPENMLGYVVIVIGGLMLYKAIDSGYIVSANIEHNGNSYQFDINPSHTKNI